VDQILNSFGDSLRGILDSPVVQVAIRAVALYVILVWLGSAFWAFRDAGRRTHNLFAPYAAGALVILASPLFFPFALVLYAIVRPGETLVEAWERRMTEEAALEAVPLCAACGRRTDPDWLACPSCGQRLHRRCVACGRLMGLEWNLCAWCGSEPAAAIAAVPLSIADAERRAPTPPFVPAAPPDRAARLVGGASDPGASRAAVGAEDSESVAAFASSRLPLD
jgi:RNA polymerase subunit RPABC4/transcription elongation factor Spt4